MTQRIFDVENEKDMQALWSILPDEVTKIQLEKRETNTSSAQFNGGYGHSICENLININWRGKTEITRPIQGATKQDIGKLCKFWDFDDGERKYGILRDISSIGKYQMYSRDDYFNHARRLTKQEIEELC